MKLFFIALIISTFPLQAQIEPGYVNALRIEEQLKEAFVNLLSMEDSPERDSLNQYIIDTFSNALETWDGFYYQWNSLQNIGRVSSEDQKLKIFTWHLTDKKGNHKYFGILVHRVEKKRKKRSKNEFRVVELNDNSDILKAPQNLLLTPENWYGSLYYRITTFEFRKKSWYVLYGYDLNDNFSQQKSLDILTLDNREEIHFGGDIYMDDKVLKRLIFEYSDQVVMSINYDSNLDMIVWDHLSPLEPIFHGDYRFYGPDGSFDALKFEKGEFFLKEDVDARNY
jgi:hypothetical protein